MASTRQVLSAVLIMLDETSPNLAEEWAHELLAVRVDNPDPENEVQCMYLKTILALCRFDLAHIDKTEALLREAALVAERLHPRLSVLVAWYLAHLHYMRTLDAIGRGADPEQGALSISTEFMTIAKFADEAHNNPLHAGLAYSVAAEYALRGGERVIAQNMAGRSIAQLTRVVGTDDPRIEQRMLVNEAIMNGVTFRPSEVLELLSRPGELQDTLPGE